MTIIEALQLCQYGGHKVRPVCWQITNSRHWVEYRFEHFAEFGEREEIPHTLRLATSEEFLGEWEVYP